jgi:hypothetical protein
MLKNAAVALLETGAFPKLSKKRSNDAAMDKGAEQRLILCVYEPKKAGVGTVHGSKGPKTTNI